MATKIYIDQGHNPENPNAGAEGNGLFPETIDFCDDTVCIPMQHGVDSLVGRTVAVMLGSTETTFYTISVYFGATGIKSSRYTVFAALFADLAGFVMAALTVKYL